MSDDQLWEDGTSLFRPSYSATWMNCSGSLLPSRWAPDTAGEDAAIGTVFHLLMAEWQKNARPDDWLGTVVEVDDFHVTVDEEMFAYGEDCLNYFADFPGDRFVETRVDISDLTPIPNQGGTADLAICLLWILVIIDWKYGRGVQVFAENNTQGLLYAWGFFQKYDWIYHFKTIQIWIAQPRLNHFDVWEITREELIEFAAYAKERAYAAWNRNADRSASPKACQWCKVRVDCVALEAAREALADLVFEVIEEPISDARMKEIVAAGSSRAPELPDPVTLPTAQLAQIQKYRKMMETWFAKSAEELTTRALQGEQVEGWKVVEGRSRRQWKDDQRTAEKLSLLGLSDEEIYEQKLVSPNKSEKLLRAIGVGGGLMVAFLRTLVYRPPGKPTLAPDGDNRLAIPNPVDDVFEAEDADQTEI